jgi:uncharacterized protein (TIGR00290 family)
MKRAWMSWSSGKDSAYALHTARTHRDLHVAALLVTVNADADRVAMHAVRRTLLEMQADRVGLPLHVVAIPSPCPNEVYEEQMATALDAAKGDGIEVVIFGDLFLDDVRAYREAAMAPAGLEPYFPLWGEPTDQLADRMIADGVRARVTCVDPQVLPAEFAGRSFDHQLLDDLPEGVDPCGERGEFHTFAWDSPGFSAPIDVQVGPVVERDGFVFCDLEVDGIEPASSPAHRRLE